MMGFACKGQSCCCRPRLLLSQRKHPVQVCLSSGILAAEEVPDFGMDIPLSSSPCALIA